MKALISRTTISIHCKEEQWKNWTDDDLDKVCEVMDNIDFKTIIEERLPPGMKAKLEITTSDT